MCCNKDPSQKIKDNIFFINNESEIGVISLLHWFFLLQIIIAALIAVAVADKDATVLRSDSAVEVDGYNYAYETSNKIVATETGKLKNVGTENEAIDITGEYSFITPEGQTVKVTYIANENGFQPSSDVLPVAPEVPEYIQRAIKLLPVVARR